MALQPLFFPLLYSGILNSYKRFIAYALALFCITGNYFWRYIFSSIYGSAGLAGCSAGSPASCCGAAPECDSTWVPLKWFYFRWQMRNSMAHDAAPRVWASCAASKSLVVTISSASFLEALAISVVQYIPIGFWDWFCAGRFPTLSNKLLVTR
jgi:hypothetical protein